MSRTHLMIVLLAIWILVAAGCAGSAQNINKLSVGMTKADVIAVMGEPNFTNGANDVEILSYKLRTDGLFTDLYFIRLKQGKVDRFGQQGSVGSYY